MDSASPVLERLKGLVLCGAAAISIFFISCGVRTGKYFELPHLDIVYHQLQWICGSMPALFVTKCYFSVNHSY